MRALHGLEPHMLALLPHLLVHGVVWHQLHHVRVVRMAWKRIHFVLHFPNQNGTYLGKGCGHSPGHSLLVQMVLKLLNKLCDWKTCQSKGCQSKYIYFIFLHFPPFFVSHKISPRQDLYFQFPKHSYYVEQISQNGPLLWMVHFAALFRLMIFWCNFFLQMMLPLIAMCPTQIYAFVKFEDTTYKGGFPPHFWRFFLTVQFLKKQLNIMLVQS